MTGATRDAQVFNMCAGVMENLSPHFSFVDKKVLNLDKFMKFVAEWKDFAKEDADDA